MHPRHTLSVLSLTFSAALAAAEGEQENLLALLAEQTDIATKTHLNADYVPGIVTVLQGSDLGKRGARTVWEALAFVPGINTVTDQVGHRRIVVRGLGAIGDNYSFGSVKVLLNGVAMNGSERGFADPVFFMPIEQIERIEVIRGPGSTVYGEFAMAGVVNVITRSGQQAFARVGAGNEKGGGFSFDAGAADAARLSLNLAAWGHDATGRASGRDAAYQEGIAAASHAPGEVNDVTAARSAAAEFAVGRFTLLGHWTEHEIGDHFGINHLLPPETRPVERNRIRSLEGRYRHPLASGELLLFAGELSSLLRKDGLYAFPPEVLGLAGDLPVRVGIDYEERNRYFGTDLNWHRPQHDLLLGLYRADVKVLQDRQSYNLAFPGGMPVITDTEVDYGYPVAAGTQRRIDSVVVQDVFRATDQFTLTSGVRYDDYPGIGSSLSPRIAAVWRAGERRTVKAQFGRAFRPPTLNEQAFGAADIGPMTADTFELGFITKGPRGGWRITLFETRLDEVIVFDQASAPAFYRNAGSAVHRGAELEADRQIGTSLLLNGYLAYLDTADRDGQAIAGSSPWLGRLGAVYRPNRYHTVAVELHALSGYERQSQDPRPAADGYGVVDLTWSYAPAPDWKVQLGAKNLFDAPVKYPAFLASGDVVTYPDDLPGPDPAWWLAVTAAF